MKRNISPAGHEDERWRLRVRGFNPQEERAVESLLAIGNGYIGSRASLAEGHPASNAGTFLAGVFSEPEGSSPPELVRAPDWLSVRITVGGEVAALDSGDVIDHTRHLELFRGMWIRDWRHYSREGRITSIRLEQSTSLADPHALLQRLEITPENYSGEVEVELRLDGRSTAPQDSDPRPATRQPKLVSRRIKGRPVLVLKAEEEGITVAFTSGTYMEPPPERGPHLLRQDGIAGEVWTWQAELGNSYRIDRIVSVFSSRDNPRPMQAARLHLDHLLRTGSGALMEAHEAVWAKRWQSAGIALRGDPAMEQALRFATYHLISSANEADEHTSIGARGLTGEAYRGHVFWDTEIFMLPVFVFTNPPAARALLKYRFHTLPAARRKADQVGYRGALYAWESTDSGEETTPLEVVMPGGRIVPVLNGLMEHHISADVAYAVWQYWRVTLDDAFFRDAGAEIVLETARFWASIATQEADGQHHIRGVIGPDEYHENVDNNAYTNLMARWNLRFGRRTAQMVKERWPSDWHDLCGRLGLTEEEVEQWERIADRLVVVQDEVTGVIEQFEGYHELDEVDLRAYQQESVSVALLLGHERTRQTQVIKQADVLMALALIPDEFPASVHQANFAHYEPRTAHGSSLSPGIHALLAARVNDLGRAERYLRQTAAIDLDDQMANAAGGVHMAALGSLWQAVVFGFAGVAVREDGLALCPRLAARWQELQIPLLWRNRSLLLDLRRQPDSSELRLESGPPLVAHSESGETVVSTSSPLRFFASGDLWELKDEVRQ
jgi:kojibiose phosphorylase